MSDFDQDLYDAVMAQMPGYYTGKEILAYRESAKVAARIAAERQATVPPSDEAAIDILFDCIEPLQAAETEAEHLAIVRAVRQALGAWPKVPVVPESVTHWHVVVNGEHGPGFTVYTNCDTTTDCHTFDAWGYHPSDPAAALQAAIDQIGGAE